MESNSVCKKGLKLTADGHRGTRVLQFCMRKKLRDWQLTLSLEVRSILVFWFRPSALVLYVIICGCGLGLGSQVFVNITDLQWGWNGTGW